MSDTTRHKKDGENQNKAAERMHEAEKISHQSPGERSDYVKEQESHNKTPLEQLDRDDFDKDLRPNEMAGENHGADTAQNEKKRLRPTNSRNCTTNFLNSTTPI